MKQAIEKKIVDANAQKFGEIQSLGPRPQIERYTKTRRERHWGLGGILKWIWNGNPGTEVRYEEEDDSAVRQYESDKAEIQERYNSEIEQAKSKLQALGDTNSRKYQILKQQLDRKMERKREALAELEKEQDAYIEKDKHRAIRKAQNYIDECAQEIFYKTRKQIIEKMHAQQDSMTKEALHIIQNEPERIEALWDVTNYALKRFKEEGFEIGETQSPIIPLYVRDIEKTFIVVARAFEEGVFINPVIPPACAPSDTLVRYALMATHTKEQVDISVERLKKVFMELGVIK